MSKPPKLVVIDGDESKFPPPRAIWPRAEVLPLLGDQLHAVMDQVQGDPLAVVSCTILALFIAKALPEEGPPEISRPELAGAITEQITRMLTRGAPECAVVVCGLAAVRFSMLLFGADVSAEELSGERGAFLAACGMELAVSATIGLAPGGATLH